MTQRYFTIFLCAMAAGLGAGLYLYAFSLAGPGGRAVLSGGLSRIWPDLRGDFTALWRRGIHAGRPGEHVGVTERSTPLRAAEAFQPGPPTLRVDHPTEAALDAEALAILGRYDEWVASWRRIPPYIEQFQRRVDEKAREAGLDLEAHRRWRQRAWEMSTGSYPVLDRELVTA